MSTSLGNLQQASQYLGVRGELVLEASLGANKVAVLQFKSTANKKITYVAEIYKEAETKLLVSPGSTAFMKPTNTMNLEHYGLRESGVSGFIKSQVTGESFVMTEVIGSGSICLTPSASSLIINQCRDTKFCIPNVNIAYIKALMGNFEVSHPQKTKSALPIIYTEIKLQQALLLLEADEYYEVIVNAGSPLDVESAEITFWSGDLSLEEVKDSDEGDLIRFSGNGRVYLSLSA
jgi:hypothetical protein